MTLQLLSCPKCTLIEELTIHKELILNNPTFTNPTIPAQPVAPVAPIAPVAYAQTGANNRVKKVTRYQDGIVEDIQYASVDEAVQAGAKAHTLRELTTALQLINEDLKLGLDPVTVTQAIYNRKKQQILDSMAKRDTTASFDGIQL